MNTFLKLGLLPKVQMWGNGFRQNTRYKLARVLLVVGANAAASGVPDALFVVGALLMLRIFVVIVAQRVL